MNVPWPKIKRFKARAGRAADPAQGCPTHQARDHRRHGLWIDTVLHLEHPRGQPHGGVALKNRHDGLGENRALIKAWCHAVDGQAVEFHAIRKGPRMGVKAGVRGQEGGVNIEQTTRISLTKRGREDPHEPGEHDDVWCESIDCIAKGRIECLSRLVGIVVDDDGGEPPGLCMGEALRIGPIRQDC